MRTLETPGIVLFTSLGESILFTCENKWNGDCKCFQCLETKLYGCQNWQIKVNIIISICNILSFYKKGPPTLKLSCRCNKSMIFSLHRPATSHRTTAAEGRRWSQDSRQMPRPQIYSDFIVLHWLHCWQNKTQERALSTILCVPCCIRLFNCGIFGG